MLLPEPLMRTEGHVVLDIADMIRRDGHRLYGGAGICAYQASLCGLQASFARDGQVLALKSADLHVDIALALTPVDDSDGIERYKAERVDVTTSYMLGDAAVLDAWHRHLSAYRRSMRAVHTAAA